MFGTIRPNSMRNVAPQGQRAFGQAQSPQPIGSAQVAAPSAIPTAAAPAPTPAPVAAPAAIPTAAPTGPTPNAMAYQNAAPQAAFNQGASPQALANALQPGINQMARPAVPAAVPAQAAVVR